MPRLEHCFRSATVAALALFALAACGTTQPASTDTRTQLRQSASGKTVSSLELRRRINDTVPRFIGRIEKAADQIREASDDPVIRRRSIEWKLDAVQAVQYAAFQPDLGSATLDLWLLSVQMDDAFTSGKASDWFGEQQPIAREAAQTLHAQIEGYIEQIARTPEAFQHVRGFILETAASNPIDARISHRASIASVIGTLSEDPSTGAFAMVRDVADSVAEMSTHLNSYMTTVPKLGRWHAELMTEEMATNLGLPAAVNDVNRLAVVFEGSPLLAPDAIENVLGASHEMITAERLAMSREIDRQRLDTLRVIAGERAVLLQAITAERQATLVALRQERIETIEAVEQMRKGLIADAYRDSFGLIDHLTKRIAQLAIGAALCVGLCVVVAMLMFRRTPKA